MPLVRSFARIDNVVRVLIVVILSSLILPILPGPAEARTKSVNIDAVFSPNKVEPGKSSTVQLNVSASRLNTAVAVEVEIVDGNNKTVSSKTWQSVKLSRFGRATNLNTNFNVPNNAAAGAKYRANVSVRYGSFLVGYERNAATLEVAAAQAPEPTATSVPPTATATAVPPTATAVPPTATAVPPTATPTDEPSPTATDDPVAPPMQLPDSSSSVLRVNSGGPSFVDSRGLAWQADSAFSGGGAYSVSDPISGTNDDAVYQSERWGQFSYTFDIPNGSYDLRLLFAEIWFHNTGERVFSVYINGQPTVVNLDILSQASRMAALDRIIPVTVTDGKLRVVMPSAPIDEPKLSGLELLKTDAIEVPSDGPAATPSPSPTATPAPTATPSPTSTVTPGTTIQAMINAASPNSTVRVPAGTYREKIYINKSIKLIADPGVTVDGENRDRWIVGEADNVTIEGFTFINSNQPQYHGGLSNDGHSNWTVRNNTFRNAGNAAIDIKQGSGHLIENNTVTRSGNVGIRIESVGSGTIRGNSTSGNNTKNLDPGWEAGGMKITGNYGGVRNLVIENNESFDNNGPGIWVDVDGQDIEIRNNRIHHNSRAGIIYELSFGGRIHGNVVYNNGAGFDAWGFGAGIMVQNSSDTEVYDNVVAWNPDGITVIAQNRGESRWNNVTGNSIHDNTIITNHDGGWNTYSLAWLQDFNGVLGNSSSNNRGYNNKFWFSTPEGSELRFRWVDDGYWTVSEFGATPGGQGSQNLSNSQKNQVLASAGL